MISRCLCPVLFALIATSASPHPHVFVDGRVDFVFSKGATLQGIEVTWLYDPFETLYILSSLEIDPGQDWVLTDADRAKVIAHESNWTETFNGAARLAYAGQPIALAPPTDFAASLVGNQLEVRFERALSAPFPAAAEDIEVSFYEATYFFAFTISEPPRLLGAADGCAATLSPFDPDAQMTEIQTMLQALGREETPQDLNVGALFTDRIYLSCAQA